MLLCVTANHRNTPFETLERLALDADAISAHLADAHPEVRGVVALSTCNRVEVYLDVDAHPLAARELVRTGFAAAIDTLSDGSGTELGRTAEVLDDPAAVHHLFSVSAGLESVAVGEEEIAGQVRRAASAARESGTSSGRLDHLFQEAIRTARAARAQGDASRAGRSLARLALDLVGSRLVGWASARVLLIGTGKYATTTVAALRDRGAVDIAVYSPTGRAQAFAAKHGLSATNHLGSAMLAADVIVTCTTRLTVGMDDVPPGVEAIVVDLGLPRNVDPAIAERDGISLLDLETIRLHAPLLHWSAEEDARAVVDESAHAYVTSASVEPPVVALRQHVLGLVEAEIERARRAGDDGRVEEALRHLTSVLLHTPSTLARRHAAAGRGAEVAAAVETLFGVEVYPETRSSSASSASPYASGAETLT